MACLGLHWRVGEEGYRYAVLQSLRLSSTVDISVGFFIATRLFCGRMLSNETYFNIAPCICSGVSTCKLPINITFGSYGDVFWVTTKYIIFSLETGSE
jgi:hypothetical protein